MKKIFIAAYLLMATLWVTAQAKPSYTQYVLNNYILRNMF